MSAVNMDISGLIWVAADLFELEAAQSGMAAAEVGIVAAQYESAAAT